ncbi:PREDICTED: adenylate isopentenyltransferase 1, chloroplastic-like isoform X3 [Camelina sativa]|uniref:Adenylate isopentenyltransferase 1, chloroplastic-like isoform X3 n=2 Tax=Camelina sativa TaxID=90675 RepID=A0ABM0Z8B1_CAMSA|nr:PREDICTED: adenylate isopentenyltransferase 1, chloroplastic-like isoform X3 [Camelina sativa]
MTELNFLLQTTISDRLITTTTTTPSFSSSHSSASSSSRIISFTKRRRKHQPLVVSIRMEDQYYYSRPKDKVVVILGATGAGKSKLSVDLATRFPSEIINSDKIQVYEGLEITTNQITLQDRRGVPHHLLGYLNPEHGELTAAEFRSAASNAVEDITSRQKLPIIAGGSNSFVHALLSQRFDPKIDPFSSGSGLISSDLRYNCCFIWVDVSETVLYEYLLKRVDEMMDSGMFEELSGFYDPVKSGLEPRFGIRKAIGVPEFDGYFKEYPPGTIKWDDALRKAAYDKAVDDIKRNTWTLAKRQIKKIEMLKDAGWEIQRVDATASFKEVMKMSTSSSSEKKTKKWREVWEEQVLEPSVKIVKRLLVED